MTAYMQVNSPEMLKQHREAMERRRRLQGSVIQQDDSAVWPPNNEREISKPIVARDWLVVTSESLPRVKISDAIHVVCKHYGVSRTDLLSQRRTANVVKPRQIAMYLAKTLTLHSLPEIGRRFGGRDHTTIRYGVLKIERLIQEDSALAAVVDQIRRKIIGGEP